MARLLPEFGALLTQPIPLDPPTGFPPFNVLWRNRVLRSKSVSIEMKLAEVLRQATGPERVTDDTGDASRDAPFLPYLLAVQGQFLVESPIITVLDDHLAESVIGVRYRSAGSGLAQAGAQAFATALAESPRLWADSASHEKLWRWYPGKGTLFGTVLSLICGLVLLPIMRETGLLFVGLAAMWFGFGLARPFLACATRYKAGLPRAIMDEVRACQADAADAMSLETIDRVIDGMVAELAPRPLQKLLLDSGQLKL